MSTSEDGVDVDGVVEDDDDLDGTSGDVGVADVVSDDEERSSNTSTFSAGARARGPFLGRSRVLFDLSFGITNTHSNVERHTQ